MTIVKKVRLLQHYQDSFKNAPLILPGTYTVEDQNHHSYKIVNKGFFIPKELCEDIETEEYATEYVSDLEQKLVDAGKDLVREREVHNHQIEIIKRDLVGICSRNGIELGSTKGMIQRIGNFVDETVAVNIANAMKLNGLTEILTQIDNEQGGFEVNPEYPIGSMDTIRGVLRNWRKKIMSLNEEVRQKDKELESLRDQEQIKEPVKVPADVAESLDFLIQRYNSDVVYGQILQRPHVSGSLMILSNESGSHFSKASKWRYENTDLFPDLMKYGYVAEKSEREKKIEEIISDFFGMNIHITEKQAGMIYDKFVEVK